MRKGFIRLLCIVLIIAFSFSSLAGCQRSEETQQPPQKEDSGSKQQNTGSNNKDTPAPTELALPIVAPDSVTLRVACLDNWYTPKSYTQNLPVYQEMEKKTGVKVKWEISPPDQYTTVMQTRLAAASDLPDILHIPGSATNTVKVGGDGLIIPLENLIEKHAPDVKRLFEANPLVKKALTAPDGHIYYLPQIGEGVLNNEDEMRTGKINGPVGSVNQSVPGIRKDWLDKLGLKEPQSLDDWYNVLKAFKEKDPNGNGKNDEIPLAPTWGSDYIFNFGTAYGLYVSAFNNGWGVDKNGKVFYQWLDPKMKDLLTWLNKLYKEGLIDPEFSSATYERTQAKVHRDQVGSVPQEWISNLPSWENALRASGVKDAHWIPVLPAKGDGEYKVIIRHPVLGGAGISKDCKKPEVAIKWLDFHLAHPDGIRLQMYGVEGMSYTMENGKPKYNDYTLKNKDGLGPFEAVRALGGWAQLPYIQTGDAYKGLYSKLPDIIEFSSKANKYGEWAFPLFLGTPEETNNMNAAMTELDTYRKEMMTKFVMGQEPISKFDEYVAKMKAGGIENVIKIKQTQYERYNKK